MKKRYPTKKNASITLAFFVQPATGRSAAGPRRVAQCLDLVMVALHALELALDHHADIRRQVLVERLAVALERHVLTPLAFVEDGLVILAGAHGFQVEIG